jgi:hypothetical protein
MPTRSRSFLSRGEPLRPLENSFPQTIISRCQEMGGLLIVYETAKQWYCFFLKNT